MFGVCEAIMRKIAIIEEQTTRTGAPRRDQSMFRYCTRKATKAPRSEHALVLIIELTKYSVD